jgi:hypothetical protein
MAGPFLEFNLITEFDRLRGEPTWNTGRNARTLMKYDEALEESAFLLTIAWPGRAAAHTAAV